MPDTSADRPLPPSESTWSSRFLGRFRRRTGIKPLDKVPAPKQVQSDLKSPDFTNVDRIPIPSDLLARLDKTHSVDDPTITENDIRQALKWASYISQNPLQYEYAISQISPKGIEAYSKHFRLSEEEKRKLEQFPDIKKVAEPVPSSSRYQHATSEHNAKDISQNGLRVESQGIEYSAHPLSGDYDKNMLLFSGRWNRFPALTLIQLPDLREDDQKSLDALNERNMSPHQNSRDLKPLLFMEERHNKLELEKTDRIIPSRYIEGYIDFKNGRFIPNPNFNPVLSDAEYAVVKQRLSTLQK